MEQKENKINLLDPVLSLILNSLAVPLLLDVGTESNATDKMKNVDSEFLDQNQLGVYFFLHFIF